MIIITEVIGSFQHNSKKYFKIGFSGEYMASKHNKTHKNTRWKKNIWIIPLYGWKGEMTDVVGKITARYGMKGYSILLTCDMKVLADD